MTEYQKLVPKQYARAVDPLYKESVYWKKFKVGSRSIRFEQRGTTVNIYCGQKNQVINSITKISNPVRSADIRRDAKLLVTGDSLGELNIFDVKMRVNLRNLKAHTAQVNSVRFLQNQQTLSASSDATVRIWDITSKIQLSVLNGHQDNVCATAVSGSNPNLIFTGSDDHTVKLWDVRMNMATLTLDHGAPVKSLLVCPGSSLLVSAGGTEVKIWDIFLAGKLLTSLDIHQKTITSLTFDNTNERIITGSLDHQSKIICTKQYKTLSSFKYSAPIGCVAFSPNGSSFVVGMTDGLLSIRRRAVKAQSDTLPGSEDTRTESVPGVPPQKDAGLVIDEVKRKALKPYDSMLKSFRYSDALDSAFAHGPNTKVVISLFEELIVRKGLVAALKGRGEDSLRKIIGFIIKNLQQLDYTPLLIKVTEILLDIYGSILHNYASLKQDLLRLNTCLSHSIYQAKFSMETLGCVSAILAASKN